MLSGKALGQSRRLHVRDNNDDWFEFGDRQEIELGDLDAILMRKDPPFDMEYVYTTYILDRAQTAGALIVNAPQALRDMNEKAYTAWFPQCTPTTLITRSMDEMKAFLAEHDRVVVKPLDGMGGRSIFVVKKGDKNANVIFETLTDYGRQFAMAQVYIPEIIARGQAHPADRRRSPCPTHWPAFRPATTTAAIWSMVRSAKGRRCRSATSKSASEVGPPCVTRACCLPASTSSATT